MRILVLRDGGGLGDAVTVQAAIAGLHEKYPGAAIDWVLPADLHSLFYLDPAISQLVPSPREGRRRFDSHREWDLARYGLDPRDYDRVVDLWCPCWRYERDAKCDVRKSRIENFCEEAGVAPRAPKLYVADSDRAWARKTLADLPTPRFLLAWRSANQRKDYASDAWREVATRLLAAGGSVVFADRLLFPEPPPGTLQVASCPKNLLAGLAAEADCVVGPDSGINHLAAALGTSTVWLFGPTNPISTLAFYSRAFPLWRPDGLDCDAPCYYSRDRRARCFRREGDCMTHISPELVAKVAERMVDWEAAEAANARAMRGDWLYRHYLTLNGVGVDYRAYGSWQAAYAEMLDEVLGIRGRKVLDVGSACGAQVKGMLARGADAQGVEPDKWMVEHAVEGLDWRLRRGKPEDGKLPAAAFDVVHSSQTLEHVATADVPAHLAAIFRALRPGGFFVAFLALDDTPGAHTDRTHLTLKNIPWWLGRVEEAGFEICSEDFRQRLEAEPFYRQYRWPWFVARRPAAGAHNAKEAA